MLALAIVNELTSKAEALTHFIERFDTSFRDSLGVSALIVAGTLLSLTLRRRSPKKKKKGDKVLIVADLRFNFQKTYFCMRLSDFLNVIFLFYFLIRETTTAWKFKGN